MSCLRRDCTLPDGPILGIFGDYLQPSYEDGDRNDLTLTVMRKR